MGDLSAQIKSKGWKIEENLGEGRHGEVFAVTKTDATDGRKYALKALRKNADHAVLGRFRKEFETLSKIDHPAVVKALGCSDEGDALQCYWMEHIDGARSLRHLMKHGKNPFANDALKAVDGFIQIAEGLDACEKLGVVHRDLSPANILVDKSGAIKIIDFGLCQVDDGHCYTLAGDGVGTPHYRPPECGPYTEVKITTQSDLYSTGKILWSMLANKEVFDREQPAFNQASMVCELPQNIPAWHLQRIFEKTIRKDVANRYRNAKEAIAGARNVRRLIVQGFRPLEALGEGACPFCGSTQDVDQKYNALIDRAARDINQVLNNSWRLCGYCFHVIVAFFGPQKQFLEERKKFD